MTHDHLIFNRHRVKLHRDRAARRQGFDFLLNEMAVRLVERLSDMRQAFPQVLDLGAHNGLLSQYIRKSAMETLVQTDMSEAMLRSPVRSPIGLGWGHACSSEQDCPPPGLPPNGGGVYKLVADEEYIPFAAGSFDLVISAGSLHWVNDVPGTLIQINRILKPGGLFLASIPGGETLKELRQSLEQAEIRVSGGVSPRISPFVDVKDAGSLLQRAGFVEPVTDSELLTVTYGDPMKFR